MPNTTRAERAWGRGTSMQTTIAPLSLPGSLFLRTSGITMHVANITHNRASPAQSVMQHLLVSNLQPKQSCKLAGSRMGSSYRTQNRKKVSKHCGWRLKPVGESSSTVKKMHGSKASGAVNTYP